MICLCLSDVCIASGFRCAAQVDLQLTVFMSVPVLLVCAVACCQADLQKEVERSKSLAEAEGRIKENRENEDVNRRAALLK